MSLFSVKQTGVQGCTVRGCGVAGMQRCRMRGEGVGGFRVGGFGVQR